MCTVKLFVVCWWGQTISFWDVRDNRQIWSMYSLFQSMSLLLFISPLLRGVSIAIAFCIIFQYKFNCNVCVVIGLTCFGNFGKFLIWKYGFSSIVFYGQYNTFVLFWVYLNNYCTTWMCHIWLGLVFLTWIQLWCQFAIWTNLFW